MNRDLINAILFDSGRVLNHPRTGHWFIPPNFFNFVNKIQFEALGEEKINYAFKEASKYKQLPFNYNGR